MASFKKNYSYDSNLVLDDGGTTFTASGVGEVASSTKTIVLDDGMIGQPMYANLNVAAVDGVSGDEVYIVRIETASDSGFTTNLSNEKEFTVSRTTADDTKFDGGFSPQYKYLRVFFLLGGTTPSFQSGGIWVAPAQ